MDVPRDDLIKGVDHADDGLLDLVPGVAHRVEQRPVLGPLEPFFHLFTSHLVPFDRYSVDRRPRRAKIYS